MRSKAISKRIWLHSLQIKVWWNKPFRQLHDMTSSYGIRQNRQVKWLTKLWGYKKNRNDKKLLQRILLQIEEKYGLPNFVGTKNQKWQKIAAKHSFTNWRKIACQFSKPFNYSIWILGFPGKRKFFWIILISNMRHTLFLFVDINSFNKLSTFEIIKWDIYPCAISG